MSGSHMVLRRCWTLAVLAFSMLVLAAAAAAATESRVTVGRPLTPFPQNKQNEPAVAIDASRPSVLAAGSNDEIDLAPCGTTVFATAESPCPFTPGVGVSGTTSRSTTVPAGCSPATRAGARATEHQRWGRSARFLVLGERPRLRR